MKLKITLLITFALFAFGVNAQETNGTPPNNVGHGTLVRVAPSIASKASLIPADVSDRFIEDGRASRNYVVPGKGSTGDDVLSHNPHRLSNTIQGRMPSIVFESSTSNASPTDPSGAVGPNHYFAVFNTGFKIYDKNGIGLTAELSPANIGFSGGFCCDLTVSYDNAADRWVVSILYGGAGPVEVAVSNSPDPINTTWNVYNYASIGDYNKLSVWSDGYYLTSNINSGSAGTSNVVFALERDAMLAGDANPGFAAFPLPGIATSGFFSPQAFNVTDDNLPAAGSMPIVYMQDDAWGGVTNDHVKLWEIDVDWATPANSMISAPLEIALTPFTGVFDGGAFDNLSQPTGGADIDAMQATIMNQAQFRRFGSHNSAVFNFVVDTDGTAGELAGIRWMELRQSGDGQPWTLYQEGTYTAPDGKHAWNASLAMDVQGNIGMGYVGMSGPTTGSNIFVSSYYTGRLANDPLGTMTINEELIQAGNGLIPNLRYSDYSKIDVDPSNDKAFWYNTEVPVNGRKTYAGVFQLAPNTNNDVGVISIDTPVSGALTNAETVTVTVFNFGELDASGFDVTYQIDGGATITEAFPGTLASQTSMQYTFTATADLSIEEQVYSITSCTVLAGDEDTTNDCTTSDVTHICASDLGVIEITSPTSGEGLGTETVSVTIQNFGTTDQSNFDVTYTVDGGTPVTETVAGPLPGGGVTSYTFTATVDLSAVATYSIIANTSLAGDCDATNDAVTASVTNVSCLTTDATDTPVSISATGTPTITSTISITDDFLIEDVNVTLDITHTWVSDLDMKLIAPDGTEVILAEDQGGSDDNYTNTTFDDEATTPITGGSAPFTGTFQPQGSLADFNGIQSVGDWTLSIFDDANQDGGSLNSWSLQLCGNLNLSVDDNQIAGDLQVIHQGDSQFLIKLPTSVTDRLTLTVTNMLGQTLLSRRLDNENGQGYEYALDMSYVSAGMYMVRIGNNEAGNIKRIIVE